MSEVSPQNIYVVVNGQSAEPEITKKKRGRPKTNKDEATITLKKKKSRKMFKVIHSSNNSSDALAITASPLVSKITNENNLVLVDEVKNKIDTSIITSLPIELPNQKPSRPLGTARKRISGEGKVASLQRILLELPNLCDPNVFTDILMKTYGSRFEASKIFECLKTSDLKDAIMKKFTPSEMIALIQNSGSVTGQFLKMASSDEILDEVQSREELKNSGKLLDVVLTNNKAVNNNDLVKKVLNTASIDAVVNTVNSRYDLKNSEMLFNVLLHNLPQKISDEMKKNIINILINKFTTSELVDISHEAIRSSVTKYRKN
ncbi:uncharacterized protein LOC131670954 isoform X2 [Phymastichus coffea]|uniref:uncharacterized protein LOC131670954 isoform X2 n=1 Tax=Phymastichus coffea TaxID=108790 RepID=UPI00273BC06C|nr:uncharacterized protein LOC131670954 isoform X2 [Phymastichus coffea]